MGLKRRSFVWTLRKGAWFCVQKAASQPALLPSENRLKSPREPFPCSAILSP